eukprot:446935_1
MYGEKHEEWLVVRYGPNNKKTKKIQRNCADIKLLPLDHASYFKQGSTCKIYSHLISSWCNGQVIEIFRDNEGEWLKIKYTEDDKIRVCDIQRYSTDIKLLINTKSNIYSNKFTEITQLVASSKMPNDVKTDINDIPSESNAALSESKLKQVPKPWEINANNDKFEQENVVQNFEQLTADLYTPDVNMNTMDVLHPTAEDINQMNQLLEETKDDNKMHNSEFMNLLCELKDNNQQQNNANDSHNWTDQFQDWNGMQNVDNMNWDSYMNAINPTPEKQEYEFTTPNCFIDNTDECVKIIDDLTFSKFNLSYQTCIKYLVYGYYSENYNDKYVIGVIKDVSIKYVGIHCYFLFYIGYDLMSIKWDLTNAILSFEAYIQMTDDSVDNIVNTWRYLGQCHQDNENEQVAINAYLMCTKLNPKELDALIALGLAYTNQIDPHKALNYLKQFIINHADYSFLAETELNEKHESNYGYIGSKKEHKQVANMFNKALKINNDDINLHIVLGILYNITSEFDIAEKHFSKATELNPNDASLWNKLGATQANGGKCKDAIKSYKKALKLRPGYTRAISNLGISYANQDMHKEACQAYLSGLKINAAADSVWDNLTMSLMHLNRGDLVELTKHKDVKYFEKHFDF